MMSRVTVDARVAALISNTGDRVELPRAGVTCIVGGNNVGKSRLLRDTVMLLSNPEITPIILSGLELDRDPVDKDMAADYLARVAILGSAGEPGMTPSYSPIHGGSALTVDQFVQFYGQFPNSLFHAFPFLGWHATAGSLLGVATGSLGIVGTHLTSHPLSRVFRDGSLERELSNLCQEVFEFPLTLDRVNGDIRLRVGRSEVPVPLVDNITLAYADSVAQLPVLEEQGDGVKSFLGLALTIVAGEALMLFIDEPEAFLHPAQARALGRWTASEAKARDRQVLLATHDRDFVLGLLDADAPITLIRVSRDGTDTTLHQLAESQVAATWADPVLRYSNVLQGLFHRRVAVCESDSDCRFYGAVLDVLATEEGMRGRSDDTLFVPSGGKNRVATLVTSLSALGVRPDAIIDFDVLRSKSDVMGILKALGGIWSPEMNDFYIRMADVLNGASLWSAVKNGGLGGIPSGDGYVAAVSLLETIREQRLHIVPIGELEDFDKSRGVHGSAWVSGMLEDMGHVTCVAARDFVRPLVDS